MLLDPEHLRRLARERRLLYSKAQPFPHAILDSFLPESAAEGLLGEFPPMVPPGDPPPPHEVKKVSFSDLGRMGLLSQQLISELHASPFLTFLEELTGAKGLVPDPSLEGGGFHETLPGGYLAVHADFNLHLRLPLKRRVNLLLYLNKEWAQEYGGHLELWGAKMSRCVQKILPRFNRCVIFSSSDSSFHGHPEPRALCPASRTFV